MPTLRPAQPHDAPTIWANRQRAAHAQCTAHYSAEQISAWVDVPMPETFPETITARYTVATLGGIVIGSGAIDLATGRIDAVFVAPDYMHQGIGRALMAHFEQLARVQGLSELSLDSTPNAAAFYHHLGFSGEVATTFTTSRGVTLACIPMRKPLQP